MILYAQLYMLIGLNSLNLLAPITFGIKTVNVAFSSVSMCLETETLDSLNYLVANYLPIAFDKKYPSSGHGALRPGISLTVLLISSKGNIARNIIVLC